MGIYTEKQLNDLAVWTNKCKFEYSLYFLEANKIIEDAKNKKLSSDKIISQFEKLLKKHNEHADNNSRDFAEKNLRDVLSDDFYFNLFQTDKK